MTVIYRERDVKKRQRQAFIDGAEWGRRHPQCSYVDSALDDEAAKRYPLPTVTRPRVARVCNKEYRISGRMIEFRVPCGEGESCGHGEWADCRRWQASTRSLEEVGALSGLIAQPTETVEDV